MVTADILRRYVGNGLVSEGSFTILTESLMDVDATVIEETEDENSGVFFSRIETTYSVGLSKFLLWFQVYTPSTPDNVEASYGFFEIS